MNQSQLDEMLDRIAGMPRAIGRLVGDLSDSELRWKPSDTEFSALENVCHLRDIEKKGYAPRIEKLISEDNPFLPDVDGSKLAAERDYNSETLVDSHSEFTAARSGNVRSLREAAPDCFTRAGTFENVGPVTLGRLLEMMCEHDDTHIAELTALKSKIGARRV